MKNTSLRLFGRYFGLRAALLIIAATAGSVAPGAAQAGAPLVLDLDHGKGAVTFDAIGRPSALKIHAKGDAPKGRILVADGKANGTVTFKLDSLDTGIGMRNNHMKKRYLETEKYPEAKLTLKDLALPANYAATDFAASNLPFKGTLSLHGVDKPVEGKAKLARKGDELSIEAGFPLKIEDFSIRSPSFAGVTMASEVNCAVAATAPFKAQ
jgi:polyisoprenoid-binding protein YceI